MSIEKRVSSAHGLEDPLLGIGSCWKVFQGRTFLRKLGEDVEKLEANDILKGIHIVAVYHSAMWCPPCRAFIGKLANAVAEMKGEEDRPLPIKVLFVSNDSCEEDMLEHFAQMPQDWLAVPFHDTVFANELIRRHNVLGIPLLVIRNALGEIITKNGRKDIEKEGATAYKKWAA